MDIFKDTGVSVPHIRSEFVTKTFPNHISIATGLHLESHGVVDNTLFDPKYGRVLDNQDPEFWNFDNLTMPLWTLNELAGKGRRSGTMMWPGSDFPFGVHNTLPFKFFSYNSSYPFEARIDTVIDWITDKYQPVNLVYLYFEEPDAEAHAFGPESDEVTQYIKVADNTTGYLINKLKYFGIFDKVNVIILSDHGFQEVKQENIIDFTSILPQDTYEIYGLSPVLNILPNEGMIDEIYNSFKNFSIGKNFTVYKKEDLDPSWYYIHNRRIMPIVLVPDLGFVFQDFVPNYIDYYNQYYNLTRKF